MCRAAVARMAMLQKLMMSRDFSRHSLKSKQYSDDAAYRAEGDNLNSDIVLSSQTDHDQEIHDEVDQWKARTLDMQASLISCLGAQVQNLLSRAPILTKACEGLSITCRAKA